MEQFKKKSLFKDKEYDFTLMFNSRNIRRKSVPDTLAAFKLFLDKININLTIKLFLLSLYYE